MSLLPVADALEIILNTTETLGTEQVHLGDALGRITANDITSNLTQPPFAASAMDGYAVRFDDIASPLTVIGESQAGSSYDGTVGKGEAVRIFTGAPMADGADTVVIQENVTRDGDQITILDGKSKGANIRAAGGDFMEGDVLINKGTKIGARQIALLAAGNVPEIPVYKKLRVAVLSTGDELIDAGNEIGPDKIANSNAPMLCALVAENGGIPIDLGIARDNVDAVKEKIALVKDVDIFVTIGGVSVGDYDIIQDVLKEAGLKVDFWKVAMQPGKPLIYGHINGIKYFGMPGNPSSSYVCFANFMLPAMNKMRGAGDFGYPVTQATLEHDIRPGGWRMNFLRAIYTEKEDGTKTVNADFNQGSARLKTLSDANCLLVRDIEAPAAKAGDKVKIILI